MQISNFLHISVTIELCSPWCWDKTKKGAPLSPHKFTTACLCQTVNFAVSVYLFHLMSLIRFIQSLNSMSRLNFPE